LRKNLNSEQQIGFLQSLIMKDIKHNEIQEENLNKWIHMSILSLTTPETSLFEELRDEYKQKVSDQILLLKELQMTLENIKVEKDKK
jgi:hypothetical protein